MKVLPTDTPLAHGRTADVHAWGDNHILKLFHDWFPLEDVDYEMKIARAVHASGVKSPAVIESVQVHGRNGLIYERVQGESMLRAFQRQPWNLIRYAKMLAGLHAQMHDCVLEAEGIPSQRKRLQNKIRNVAALPVYLQPKLLTVLESMPQGNRVCHGDFHPDNVMLSANDATVIDWIDASSGNPLADVARTSIILLGDAASTEIPHPVLKWIVHFFHRIYLKEYFHLRPGGQDEYQRWLPIVAGARLSEGIPEIEQWLIEQAKK